MARTNDKNRMMVHKDMGLSHREFFASLATLTPESSCRVHDSGAVLEYYSGKICISLEPEEERRIGSIRLPRTEVLIEFFDLSDKQQTNFLDRFDLAFRRGGG